MRADISDIRRWLQLHKEELLKDLEQIVRIKSVSYPLSDCKPYGEGCRQVLDKMLELGARYGMEIRNYHYYVGGMTLPCSLEEKEGAEDNKISSIGIWNHLDVIEEGKGWKFPPYEMSRKDTFLIGRGVQDNKGPAMGVLYALRYIKECGLKVRHDFTLYTGCSEENGMPDVDYFVEHYAPADFNLVADCGFPVCHGEKGIVNFSFTKKLSENSCILSLQAGSSVNSIPAFAEMVVKKDEKIKALLGGDKPERITVTAEGTGFRITASGTACHVGFPQGSVNAVSVLSDFVFEKGFMKEEDKELLDFLKLMTGDVYGEGAGIACEDEISGKLCGAVTLIRMDREEVCMKADYRYPISLKNADELYETVCRTAKLYGCEVKKDKDEPPYYLDKEHPGVTALVKVYREITGSSRGAYTMSGGTYARKLPNAVSYGMSLENKKIYSENGIPQRNYGDCHQPDESLDLEQYLEGIAIYSASLLELDEVFSR